MKIRRASEIELSELLVNEDKNKYLGIEVYEKLGCAKEWLNYKMAKGNKIHRLYAMVKIIGEDKVIFASFGGCPVNFRYQLTWTTEEHNCKRC
ncbi:MAG: hypothetical protein FJ241_11805 [Nitrospira sp.]|nr:hypothetical protein [Nitrospira sp.]